MCIFCIHESANIGDRTHSETLLCHLSWIWLFEIPGWCIIPKSSLILSMRTPWSRSIWNPELPLWKAGFLSLVNLCQCLLLSQYGCDLWHVRVSYARVLDDFHSKYFGVRFPDSVYVFRFCWDFISGLTDVVLYRFGMICKFVSRPVGPGCSLEISKDSE